jgi:hypothetical protein
LVPLAVEVTLGSVPPPSTINQDFRLVLKHPFDELQADEVSNALESH